MSNEPLSDPDPTTRLSKTILAATMEPPASDQPQAEEWVLKVSETPSEREAALRLVHQTYCETGLSAKQGVGLRVLRHHLYDQSQILLAAQGGKVGFTATLIRDSRFGMPLDSLFGDEVSPMREQGLRLAEVSCLASSDRWQDKRQRFDLLVRLFSLTVQTARRRGVDRILLAVHPKHARTYERMFGCSICSEIRQYSAVQDNPAVLCMHDLAEVDRKRCPLYDRVYSYRFDPWQLDGIRMSADEKIQLAKAISSTTPDLITIRP